MGMIEMCNGFELGDRSRSVRRDGDMVRLAALGLMTSGAVHDLRNLMQVVSSAVRLIEQKLDQPARISVAPLISGALQSVDRAAAVIETFTNALELRSYALYMNDYGGPIGFRLALAHPERVAALIIQNAVISEDGLGPAWDIRKAYWKDRAGYEAKVIPGFVSLAGARERHIGSSPNCARCNPDTWLDEFSQLSRPGQLKIQADLFWSYQTNVDSYSKWQDWLRRHRQAILVLWGKYDPSFAIDGAFAYRKCVPDAEVHILDGGHFALDECLDEIAELTRNFLDEHLSRRSRSPRAGGRRPTSQGD